jgi:hypothetical protein
LSNTWTHDYYHDVPSGMSDSELTPRIYEDRKWSSPVNQADPTNADDKLYDKKGTWIVDQSDTLSQEAQDILSQGSYLQKDSKGNEYAVKPGYGTPEVEAENARLKSEWDD